MTTYRIRASGDSQPKPIVEREPTPGKWYVGITVKSEFGAVAKFVDHRFENSMTRPGESLDMTGYDYLAEQI